MSQPEIIQNCKRIIIEYLFDVIGQPNIVSIILYGSVSRNEESYRNVDGKLYLESDIDVLVVVRNRIVVINSWIKLKQLCHVISEELRKNWLLSHVTVSVTTEDRLLKANQEMNFLFLHSLKRNAKVIFGKELIGLMPSYEYSDIPLRDLSRMIFGHMTKLVRNIALSGIIEERITVDAYNSILKSIRKLTLFMIRAIIMKDGIPLNPWNLTEIKAKKSLYQIKNSFVFEDLLRSYDDIKLSDSKKNCSMVEIKRCLVRVISQFNSTIAILTEIDDPFVTLPKKLIIGHSPFTRRVEHGIYIFLTNVRTRWTVDLFKFIIFTIFRPEDISLGFYDLFISSPNLIKSSPEENTAVDQQCQSWLRLYNKSLKRWKYDVAAMQ
jgi:predicted nucleotidyltransferase